MDNQHDDEDVMPGQYYSELEIDLAHELLSSGRDRVSISELKCCEGLKICHWEHLLVAFPKLDRQLRFLPFYFAYKVPKA